MSGLRLSLILIKSILILLINYLIFRHFFVKIYKTVIMATSKYQLGLIFSVKTALYQLYYNVLFFLNHLYITWQAKSPVKNI